MLAVSQSLPSAPTLSLTGKEWIVRDADERVALALMQRHNLPEIVARVLVARGVAINEAPAFLSPNLKTHLPDPAHMLDMDKAAERVAAAVINNERIAIFGDYDVDGATSSALLARFLRALGNNPLVYIPDRMKEGYGPNAPALLKLKEQGAALAITVDCGTLAFEPLEVAANAGLDVIVVDHHIGEARLPKAHAVINPNRFDETSPHKQLAAVGVAFLLCVAVNKKLREKKYFSGRAEPDLRRWLDIVALGTVCDVVPLVGVNRALVAQGLKVMAARGNLGIKTLLDLAKINEKPGTYHLGFIIGPRINAGGRVGQSDLGVKLLTTEDAAEALTLAKELDRYNAERKAIEATVLDEAIAQAEKIPASAPIFVVNARGWHIGVLGIIAGRIKEKFGKPAAVIGVENGIGKASARSVEGFDIGAGVIAARDAGLLVAGGGHAMAAGFTVEENKIAALVEFLSQRAKNIPAAQKQLKLDGALAIGGATSELLEMLEQLGPFGQGNPSLKFAFYDVVNLRPDWTQDGKHIRTLFIDSLSSARLSGVAFRAEGTKLGEALIATRGRKVSVCGQLKMNEWNGKRSVDLHIEDIAAC